MIAKKHIMATHDFAVGRPTARGLRLENATGLSFLTNNKVGIYGKLSLHPFRREGAGYLIGMDKVIQRREPSRHTQLADVKTGKYPEKQWI